MYYYTVLTSDPYDVRDSTVCKNIEFDKEQTFSTSFEALETPVN